MPALYAIIWSPYHQHNINSVEMVRRHAARFVLSNYDQLASVTQMLNSIHWLVHNETKTSLKAISVSCDAH